MHASYQIIIQVLQLAYTTQACILNLKAYAMQASTWICTYQMKSIKVHELAPPTYVLLLSKKFWSISFLQCCSLFVHIHVQSLLLWAFISYLSSLYNINLKAFISLYNLSPFVINFHKRCASHWCKVCIWGRWLRLESCIFMDIIWLVEWHHLKIPLVTCKLYHLYLM